MDRTLFLIVCQLNTDTPIDSPFRSFVSGTLHPRCRLRPSGTCRGSWISPSCPASRTWRSVTEGWLSFWPWRDCAPWPGRLAWRPLPAVVARPAAGSAASCSHDRRHRLLPPSYQGCIKYCVNSKSKPIFSLFGSWSKKKKMLADVAKASNVTNQKICEKTDLGKDRRCKEKGQYKDAQHLKLCEKSEPFSLFKFSLATLLIFKCSISICHPFSHSLTDSLTLPLGCHVIRILWYATHL